MRPVRGLLVAAATLSVLAGRAAAPNAQAPPSPPSAQQPATTVSGTIVDAASRKPIGGAVVTLRAVPVSAARVQFEGGAAPPDPWTLLSFQTSDVMTGADGRFSFRGVPPGAYELYTWKAGWIPRPWESADPQLTGDWMTISQTTRAAEVTVPLDRATVVRGRVVDENGDPLMYMPVTAFYRDLSARSRVWQQAFTRYTDDRGLFSMVFGPGEVLLRLQPPRLPSGGRVRPKQTRLLRLRPAEDQDLEFRLERVPAYRVTGQLIGSQNLALVSLRLIPIDEAPADPDGTDLYATMRSDGRFVFPLAPVGRYMLRALETKNLPISSHGVMPLDVLPPEPTLSAEVPVTLTDRDVDVPLALQRGVRISGRVEFDGEPTPQALADLKQTAMLIQSVDDPRIDLRGVLSSNKTFVTMHVPPGRYVIRTWGPRGWALRSIVQGGKDIADEPLEISGAEVNDVVITFTTARSSLSGEVVGAAAKHRRPWVIAFPSDQRLWTQVWTTPRRVALARLGTSGTYEFGLVPGGYLVCAVDEKPAALTPDVFKELAPRAVRVWISEGDRLTQSVPWTAGARR